LPLKASRRLSACEDYEYESPKTVWSACSDAAINERITETVDRRQKAILIEVATVIIITLIAVIGMINFKDYINRSESISAMQQVGQIVAEYRRQHNRVPSESMFLREMSNIKGAVRLPGMVYRGLWIDLEAEPNDILAYAKKNYPASLLDDGYVVLRFDADTVWMGRDDFEALLNEQQSEVEKEMTRK
jgi:hypothetical protein